MYRILSLSGGGARGIFQAICLKEIAKQSAHGSLIGLFDLIAGTSTGAIIALAIALEIDLDRVVDLFKTAGPKIFRKRIFAAFRKGPRYSPVPLRETLDNVFGSKKSGDCKKPVVISATTLDRFANRVFTNLNRKRREADMDLLVVDVIMASCAAPTFFPPVRPRTEERHYVDGGLWANAPSLLAVIEAHAYAGIEFSEIDILEIGNGKFPEGAIGEEFRKLRPLSPNMISSVFDMMFATQAAAARDMLLKLVSPDALLQVNAELGKLIALDDAEAAIKVLPGEAEHAARNHLNEIDAFLNRSSRHDQTLGSRDFDATPIGWSEPAATDPQPGSPAEEIKRLRAERLDLVARLERAGSLRARVLAVLGNRHLSPETIIKEVHGSSVDPAIRAQTLGVIGELFQDGILEPASSAPAGYFQVKRTL